MTDHMTTETTETETDEELDVRLRKQLEFELHFVCGIDERGVTLRDYLDMADEGPWDEKDVLEIVLEWEEEGAIVYHKGRYIDMSFEDVGEYDEEVLTGR